MNNKNMKLNAEELADELMACLKSKEIVWIKRFALQNGMSYKKLLNRANKNDKLSEAIEMALDYQQTYLIENGLKLKTDSGFHRFLLEHLDDFCGKKNADKIIKLRLSTPVDTCDLEKLEDE